MPATSTGPSSSGESALDVLPILERFEEAWQGAVPPLIEGFLPFAVSVDGPLSQRHVLAELIKIDLDYRWRPENKAKIGAGAGGLPARPCLEDYVKKFFELGSSGGIALDLVSEEYRVRRGAGETPPLLSYQQRFPHLAAQLAQALGAVDEELRRESGSERGDGSTVTEVISSVARSADLPSIPGYEILGELGRGGMGIVFKARDLKLQRIVALKIVPGMGAGWQHALLRFRNEATAVAQLQHPNIVQIFDFGEHHFTPYFAMEFCPGGSLADKLKSGALSAATAAELAETLARAMHAVHAREIIHRDLKPGNVLFSEDGVPKITDFGLAKQLDSISMTGDAPIGTPAYMAPEQTGTAAFGPITPATDVYALGAALYEMLTGKPPFNAGDARATIAQVVNEDPKAPRRIKWGIPRDLQTICLKCLRKKPHQRYATALELAEDLRRYQDGLPIVARPTPIWERSLKFARRRPTLTALLAIGLLAIIGFGLNPWDKGPHREPPPRGEQPEAFSKELLEKWKERLEQNRKFVGQLLVQGIHPATATFQDTKSLTVELTQDERELTAQIVVKWRKALLTGYETTFALIVSRSGQLRHLRVEKDHAGKGVSASNLALQNTERVLGEYVAAVQDEWRRRENVALNVLRFEVGDRARLEKALTDDADSVGRLLLAGTHPTGHFNSASLVQAQLAKDGSRVDVVMTVNWKGDAAGLAHQTKYDFLIGVDPAVAPSLKGTETKNRAVSATISSEHHRITERVLHMKLNSMRRFLLEN